MAAGTKAGAVSLLKAKNIKKITVPKTVELKDGKKYKVTETRANAFQNKKIRVVVIGANVIKIRKNTFSGSKTTKLVVKTKKLTKARVKGSLKSSKIKTIQVKVGKKNVNLKYIRKYKKIFTAKNSGRKVTVK